MRDSSIGRVASVLFAPGETFASIARKPTWLLALVVLVVCGMLAVVTYVDKIDFEASIREQLADSPASLSEEDIETQAAFMGKFGKGLFYGAAAIMPWVAYPLMAVLLFLALRFLGGELGFTHSLSVVVHSNMPWALFSLLSIPIALGRAEMTTQDLEAGALLPSNLLAFVGSENAFMRSLLGSVDFFSLWTMVLLVIGFEQVAKVSRGRAAGTVVGLWLVWVVLKAGLAVLGQMFGG